MRVARRGPIDVRRRFDAHVAQWRVDVDDVRQLSGSMLAFGLRAGRPVVLKVLKAGSDEWRSGKVVAAFQGRATVALLEQAPGAMLMERAVPGTSLEQLSLYGEDDQATRILSRTILAMGGCTAPADTPHVADWGRGFERFIASDASALIPKDLVDDAARVFAELVASQTRTTLLHGDLHHSNVLMDRERGWLAIDPKGVVGDTEYELGAMLRNPIDRPDIFADPTTIRRRLAIMAEELPVDLDRVVAWAFAQAVLSAIWTIEDKEDPARDAGTLMLAGRLRTMRKG